jgi:hypothetical protein
MEERNIGQKAEQTPFINYILTNLMQLVNLEKLTVEQLVSKFLAFAKYKIQLQFSKC